MKNEQDEIQTDVDEIESTYKRFYEKLFEKPTWEKGDTTKQQVDAKLQKIIERGMKQESLYIDMESIEKVVKKLKRRKAGDGEGWRNELIIEGGKEMVKALHGLFNKFLREMKTPVQWEDMKIKSIYKNKGARNEMKNRRGIFLTSVIGKVFEKAVLERIGKEIKLGKFQNGGRKGKSTKDNFILPLWQ